MYPLSIDSPPCSSDLPMPLTLTTSLFLSCLALQPMQLISRCTKMKRTCLLQKNLVMQQLVAAGITKGRMIALVLYAVFILVLIFVFIFVGVAACKDRAQGAGCRVQGTGCRVQCSDIVGLVTRSAQHLA